MFVFYPLAEVAASEGDAAMPVERLEPLGERLAGGTLAGAFADRVVGSAFDLHVRDASSGTGQLRALLAGQQRQHQADDGELQRVVTDVDQEQLETLALE